MASNLTSDKAFDPAATEVNKYDFQTPATPVFKAR